MLSDSTWEQKIGTVKQHQSVQKISSFHRFETIRDHRGQPRTYDHCSVDIIIPYHCKYDLVRKSLLSILRYTQSNPYQVTLVDDGSPGAAADEFIDTISQAPQTQCIRLPERRGFGAAVLEGISATKQPYVCVMHSDCEVMHMNWLGTMGEALVDHKKEEIRMVVPLSNNPGGLDELTVPYREFESMPNDRPQIMLCDKPLPMYCFMCHRGLFKRIGPIKTYPNTGFEDEEFFYRMKYHGYKQAIANHAWIKHQGSATVKYLKKSVDNAKKFEEELATNRDRAIHDLRELYKTKKS